MPRISFTPLALKSIKSPQPTKPGQVAQADFFDESTPGFGLRISSNGVRSWFVMDRIGGRPVRITLGRFPRTSGEPGLGLADARARATAVRRDISRGLDPRLVARPAIVGDDSAPDSQEDTRPTFSAVSAQFIEKWAKPKTRRWKETERIFERLVAPEWGCRAIADISRGDVGKVLDRVALENGPIMSNRLLSALSKMFKWWQIQDETFSTPIVEGMARGIAQERDRVLTRTEVKVVWDKLPDDVFGSILKFLLLTGRRREEVAGMRREEIGQDASGQWVWTLPASRNKIKKPDEIPLTAPALAILQAQPRWDRCPYIFTPDGEHRFQNFSRRKLRLDKDLGDMPDWTVHDLRRTARTLMAELGVDERIGELCLGHTIKGIEGVYNRAKYSAEKRAALETLASELENIVGSCDI